MISYSAFPFRNYVASIPWLLPHISLSNLMCLDCMISVIYSVKLGRGCPSGEWTWGHVIIKKGGHFEKRNRPKMNLDEIVEEKFIRDLVKRKLSYHAISERLQALYPGGFDVFSCCFQLQFIQILICHFEPIIAFLSWLTEARGLSSRSVRRYCKERKIKVSEDCLEEMVVRNIEQVCIYIQVLTKFVLLFPARLPDLRWLALWIFLTSSMYVGNVIPHSLPFQSSGP